MPSMSLSGFMLISLFLFSLSHSCVVIDICIYRWLVICVCRRRNIFECPPWKRILKHSILCRFRWICRISISQLLVFRSEKTEVLNFFIFRLFSDIYRIMSFFTFVKFTRMISFFEKKTRVWTRFHMEKPSVCHK